MVRRDRHLCEGRQRDATPRSAIRANDALRVERREIRAKVIGEGANLGVHPGRAHRIRAAHGGRDQHRLHRQFGRASIARTTRSTSRSRWPPPSARGQLSEPAPRRAARGDDRRGRRAGAGGQPAAGAGPVDRAERAGQRGRLAYAAADRDARGLRPARPAQPRGWPTASALARRAGRRAGADPARAGGAAVEHQAGAAGGDRGQRPGRRSEAWTRCCSAPSRRRCAGKFRKQILAHRLRREIVATRVANRMVNRLGMVHPFELAEEEGAGLDRGRGRLRRRSNACSAWTRSGRRSRAPGCPKRRACSCSAGRRRGCATTWPTCCGRRGDARADRSNRRVGPAVAQLDAHADNLLSGAARARSGILREELITAGAAPELANQVGACSTCRVRSDWPSSRATAGIEPTAADAGLRPARRAARTRLGPGRSKPLAGPPIRGSACWSPASRATVQQMRLEFLRHRLTAGKCDPSEAVEAWLGAQTADDRQFRPRSPGRRRRAPVTPAMLAQIASQARAMLVR